MDWRVPGRTGLTVGAIGLGSEHMPTDRKVWAEVLAAYWGGALAAPCAADRLQTQRARYWAGNQRNSSRATNW